MNIYNVHARKPAVEPIQGISIEEYKKVDPKKVQGFNFDEPSKIEGAAKGLPEAPEIPITSLIGVLLLLHAGAWYFVMKKSKQSYVESDSPDNVVSIKKPEPEDDIDYPKAG